MEPRAQLIVVHRDRATTCLATVGRFVDQADLAVTVVDNGSCPEELAILESGLAPEVDLIRHGANAGFGPGANAGLRRWLASTGSDVCLVAPHDARPLPGTVDALLDAMDRRPRAGLASADVGDGAVPRIQPFLGPIDEPADDAAGWQAADYPHGTLMAARRACLDDIGLFDERYFAYCEEADLGLRATRAGWEVGVVAGALVENPESNTPAAVIDYLMVRNTLLLLRTHFGRRQQLFRLGVALAEQVVGRWRPGVKSPYHTARARRLAIRDACRGRFGPPPAALRRG